MKNMGKYVLSPSPTAPPTVQAGFAAVSKRHCFVAILSKDLEVEGGGRGYFSENYRNTFSRGALKIRLFFSENYRNTFSRGAIKISWSFSTNYRNTFSRGAVLLGSIQTKEYATG